MSSFIFKVCLVLFLTGKRNKTKLFKPTLFLLLFYFKGIFKGSFSLTHFNDDDDENDDRVCLSYFSSNSLVEKFACASDEECCGYCTFRYCCKDPKSFEQSKCKNNAVK